jgi:hypothetical protein
VQRVTIPYRCQLMHKGQPVNVVVPRLDVPKCGHCGELLFDYEADDQINQALHAAIAQARGVQPESPVGPEGVTQDGQQVGHEP